MRKFAILAASAAALVASPAFAQAKGEARVEVHGGIAWAAGTEEAFIGGDVGYDFDLGDKAFVGVEAGADKVLATGTEVFWTVGARAGIKAGAKGRAYVTGGYGFVNGGGDGPYAGVGFQQGFGKNLYGKIEYRRTLVAGPDVNFAGAGLGFRF